MAARDPLPRIRRIAVAIVCAVVAAECAILALALDGGSTAILASLHAGVALGLAAASVLLHRLGMRAQIAYASALLVIALGPFGVAAGAVLAIAGLAGHGRVRPFAQWHAAFFARPEVDRVAALAAYIERTGSARHGAGSVSSFADVLRDGSLARKQAALGLIADHFDPRFAPVLRSALNDGEAVIRVQAASIAARLEDAFQQEGGALRARAADGDIEARTLLADHYAAHARAGLVDDLAAETLRRNALTIMEPTPENQVRRARLLLELGENEAAADLARSFRQAPDDPEAPAVLLAALLRRGAFAEIRALAGRIDPDAVPGLRLWRQPAHVGATP